MVLAVHLDGQTQAYLDQREPKSAKYKKWNVLSPFYLKHHPEKRTRGDITELEQLSKMKSANILAGVEAVFEKNKDHFDKLVN